MKVRYKLFAKTFAWTKVLEEAAEFASTLPAERLISISQSPRRVVVWYWE